MNVGLIGAGNMGGALARGWHAGPGGPTRLLVSDADRGRAETLARDCGGEVAASNAALAAEADLVVLAVKPGLLEEVAAGVEPRAVASVLAGTSLEALEAAFPGTPVIRFMPNVAAQVRQGLFCYAIGSGVEESLKAQALDLFEVLGSLVELPESLLEPATALMGCGPAFVALVHEALVDAGVAEGLPADRASELVVGTLKGTAAILEASGGDSAGLRRMVTSPGGSTAAGLAALERGGARAAFQEAVSAAISRTRGLARDA